ncbi:hypothetical protein [Streptomyces triculaminicus]|uniref:hypothetical protein n=1 Tax=Streptomyces triculaminicus TaxID=2816232 RepID=UPI0037BAB05D
MATTEEIMQRGQEIHAAREAALKPLAEVLSERQRLLRELAKIDSSYGRAYADAEAAGWTPEELKALGAETPTQRPKGRPRKRRVALTAPASQSNSPSALSVPGLEKTPAADVSWKPETELV